MTVIVHCEEKTSVRRRALVISGLAATIGCSIVQVARAATALVVPRAAAGRSFSVMYKGARIGTHTVSYSSTPGEMLVMTEIHLEAKVAFFPAYALSHRSQEAWRAGRLMSLSSETVEQRERFRVEGLATPEGFRVLGNNRACIAPSGTLTSNDLWTPAILEQAKVVDARRGNIIGFNAYKIADQPIVIDGHRVQATCYKFVTPDYAGNIWYDRANHWVHGEFDHDGSKVQYQLVES